jgi:hypothetical protein
LTGHEGDATSPSGDEKGVTHIKFNLTERAKARLIRRMERIADRVARKDPARAARLYAAIDSTKAGEAAAAIGGILAFFGAFGILFVPVTSVPVLDWEFLLIVGAIVFALGLVMEASD